MLCAGNVTEAEANVLGSSQSSEFSSSQQGQIPLKTVAENATVLVAATKQRIEDSDLEH
jgi:hypothetical protein